MSDERNYIKIEIDEIDGDDTLYKPDSGGPGIGSRVSDAGQRAANAAVTAWQSEARHQATDAVRRGATVAAERGRDAITTAVSQQTRRKALNGFASGLYWLSEKISQLADRMQPPPKNQP